MEKVYAHRMSESEANIIGCATYDFKKGEIRTFISYLTTSKKNWNQPNHQLIITPNLSHTNAKALYKIRNDKGEYQVNFKRGTSFLIEKVETFEDDDIEYKRIWMKEL